MECPRPMGGAHTCYKVATLHCWSLVHSSGKEGGRLRILLDKAMCIMAVYMKAAGAPYC